MSLSWDPVKAKENESDVIGYMVMTCFKNHVHVFLTGLILNPFSDLCFFYPGIQQNSLASIIMRKNATYLAFCLQPPSEMLPISVPLTSQMAGFRKCVF